jgi:HK97 family phage major capsid protein
VPTGSNKDIRDFSFNRATATLYTIAQIADIGNQLVRQSGGVAEAQARRRVGDSIGLAESNFIVNGTGSSQPLGILQALLAFGDVAANKYTLSSESRVSALANGMAKLDARGVTPTAVVMHSTDYWEMVTETLGSSGSGGWALDPATGAASSAPTARVWGVPVYRCADLTVGTALVADSSTFDTYLGNDFRIDVSSEAGSRFDQNVTGFRAEEDFAFNAEPPVRTGNVVKITGL